MAQPLLRTDEEIAEIYRRHMKTVYRVCFAYLKSPGETEDVVQDTFCKLIKSKTVFENLEHEKAWLIRVAVNACKNTLRHWWCKRESLEGHENLQGAGGTQGTRDGQGGQGGAIYSTFEVVMSLPDKYKTVVYLYYYEGYTSVEIAGILKKPPSTIRNHLHEARSILRKELGGEFDEE